MMVEVVIVNSMEQVEQIDQAMTEFQKCLGDDFSGTIKLQCFQIKKSLQKIKAELKKMGY